MSAVSGQYLAGDNTRRHLLHGAPDTRRVNIDTKTFLVKPALQRELIARRGCGRIGHGKIPLVWICLNIARLKKAAEGVMANWLIARFDRDTLYLLPDDPIA
jgi:hypothetical protein